jgi:hypothetical protein
MTRAVSRLVASPAALITAACCLLAGCDRTESASNADAAVASISDTAGPSAADREAFYASRPPFLARERVSSFGRFLVRYRPIPDPIPLNETFDLEIEVRNPHDPTPGHSPSDLAVGINAEMTTHSHGMNVRPVVTQTGPGTYKVEGMMLHMLGHWTLNVDLTHAGITERAVFDVVME